MNPQGRKGFVPLLWMTCTHQPYQPKVS
uniref:Uncharacterized protein n=1 Tax=Tetranychus urticae TaxID=32264 RepID=T1KL13_TETUR